jgi:hypothetical protein
MSNAVATHPTNLSPNVNNFLNNITGPQLQATLLPRSTSLGSTSHTLATYGPSVGDYVAGTLGSTFIA